MVKIAPKSTKEKMSKNRPLALKCMPCVPHILDGIKDSTTKTRSKLESNPTNKIEIQRWTNEKHLLRNHVLSAVSSK